MFKENRDFFPPIAQWWQGESKGVEAIVEIFAQPLGSERFGDVDVRCCQNPDVDFDHRAAAEAGELLILENVKQLCLQQRRHLADFVEQDCPFVAEFELAGLGMRGAGEGSRLVSKQFAFQEVGGNGGAIHFEKGAMRAR